MAHIKAARSDRGYMILVYGVLLLLCAIIIYPLILVVSNSVSDPKAVIAGKVVLFPVGFSMESYTKILQNDDIVRSFFNSVRYTVAGTALNVALTVMAAYPLSQKQLRGRKVFMLMATFTMFFSGGMIPTFLVVRKMKLMNTIGAMILPGAINTYNMIITKTFFENNIPQELQEAARFDGCSHVKFLIYIGLPLSVTIIAIISMFYAVGHWNAYLTPLLYFSKSELYPLQVVLRDILQSSQVADMTTTDVVLSERFYEIERLKYATIVVASLPLMIVYPFIVKYFEKGVMLGALKG
ncbi:MAG: carbohydrate ABC transporter permease [Aristaeellaceae bacterium]